MVRQEIPQMSGLNSFKTGKRPSGVNSSSAISTILIFLFWSRHLRYEARYINPMGGLLAGITLGALAIFGFINNILDICLPDIQWVYEK